jgi:hypothetical protein
VRSCWMASLRAAENFVLAQRRETNQPRGRRVIAMDSWHTSTGWQRYSTVDPQTHSALCLELLAAAATSAAQHLQRAVEAGCMARGKWRLLVAGPCARHLWGLVTSPGSCTVMALNHKEVRNASLVASAANALNRRRLVYALDEDARRSYVDQLARRSLPADLVQECLNAVRYAFAERQAGRLMGDLDTWWSRAQSETSTGIGLCLPSAADLQTLAQIVATLCDCERRAEGTERNARLRLIWTRSLSSALRQAAAVAFFLFCDPLVVFADTMLEQLRRGVEGPLLCQARFTLAGLRRMNRHTLSALINQVCAGPACSVRLLQLLRDARHTLARVDGLLHMPRLDMLPETSLRLPLQFLGRQQPSLRVPWTTGYEQERRARVRLAIILRRLSVICALEKAFALAGADDSQVTHVLGHVCCTWPIEPGARYPRGARATAQSPTMAHLLKLAARTPSGLLTQILSRSSEVNARCRRNGPADLAPCWRALAAGATPEALSATLNGSWARQRCLLDAIHHVQHSAETLRDAVGYPAAALLGGPEGILDALARRLPEAQEKTEEYAHGCVLYHFAERMDLDQALAALATCRPRVPVVHLRRALLAQRSARFEHPEQRRRQVDTFCSLQRNLYRDRPRPRGVLDGFGHRISGTSVHVLCWAAKGERGPLSVRTKRALRSDLLAHCWHSMWRSRRPPAELTYAERRTDLELARHLLRQPPEAPSRKRARLDWTPDLSRIGAAQPTALQRLDPEALDKYREPLRARDIRQPVLRKLVSPENVPHVAMMHCLLRAPIDTQPSLLGLVQDERRKRALEPLVDAVELWPLFAAQLTATDLVDAESLRQGLRRAGAQCPVAAAVAAHHWFMVVQEERPLHRVLYDTDHGVTTQLLPALRTAIQVQRWPPPLAPFPVWLERDVGGAAYEAPQSDSERERHAAFVAAGELAWLRTEGRRAWSQERSLYEWRHHLDRTLLLRAIRPCSVFYRRPWVFYHQLPMTLYCDAGTLPLVLTQNHAPLRVPVVLVPRSSGSSAGAGLRAGPYTREEHSRQVGDPGECIFFGQQQRQNARTLRDRGLMFVATSMDRFGVFKQHFVQLCFLYLVGHCQHFPMILGTGLSSIPWLNGNLKSLRSLQRLVRQRLLADWTSRSAPLLQVEAAWTSEGNEPVTLRQLVRELPELRMRHADLPDIPPQLLTIENLQWRVLDRHRAKCGLPLRQEHPVAELRDTLSPRALTADGPLLVFPSASLLRGPLSTPFEQGGFLASKQLDQWMDHERVLNNMWPELAEDLDPRGRRDAVQPFSRISIPLQHGERLTVFPSWAYYVRGATERVGRGPRDGQAPYFGDRMRVQYIPPHPISPTPDPPLISIPFL